MQGVPRSSASARMRRMTVGPSIPGRTPSTRIAAGRRSTAARSPSSPVAAALTL